MLQHTRSILERSIANKADAFILDLYGDVGTFALAAADLCASGVTIENFEESTEYAEKNLERHGFFHMKAVCLDAASLKKLELDKKAEGRQLFVILDPPRSGMHPKTIAELIRLNPALMVYISCTLEQLARELVHFKNYTLESATVFDLFPQTPHVETVVVMRRKQAREIAFSPQLL